MLSVRGNAVEPVLLMFPLGLLTVAVILDLFHALGGPQLIGTLAYCTVVVGLLGGTMAALATRIGEATARHRTGAGQLPRRFLLDAAVLVVFAVILLIRTRTPERTAGAGLLLVEVMGLGMAGIAGLTGSSRTNAD